MAMMFYGKYALNKEAISNIIHTKDDFLKNDELIGLLQEDKQALMAGVGEGAETSQLGCVVEALRMEQGLIPDDLEAVQEWYQLEYGRNRVFKMYDENFVGCLLNVIMEHTIFPPNLDTALEHLFERNRFVSPSAKNFERIPTSALPAYIEAVKVDIMNVKRVVKGSLYEQNLHVCYTGMFLLCKALDNEDDSKFFLQKAIDLNYLTRGRNVLTLLGKVYL